MSEAESKTETGVSGSELGYELTKYTVGVIDLILFDWAEGTSLYKTAGEAHTALEAAEHDGPAIVDGDCLTFIQGDSGLITAQHPQMGRTETYVPGDHFDPPVTLLERLKPE